MSVAEAGPPVLPVVEFYHWEESDVAAWLAKPK
jgi:hypothetical protein